MEQKLYSAAATAAVMNESGMIETTYVVSSDVQQINGDQKKRGRRRKEPPTLEEKREREREKKARWRAKRKERESLSHHFEIPYNDMPKEVWDKIKLHLNIRSNGSPEEEGSALVYVLNSVGYEWDKNSALITRAPSLRQYPKLRQMHAPDEDEPPVSLMETETRTV